MSHIWTCKCDYAHCKALTTHRHKKPDDKHFMPREKPHACMHKLTDPEWKCELIYVTPEKSTNILCMAWSPFQGGRLFVNFKGGAHYTYHNIPWSYFNDMTIAPSWGKFLNSEIKGKFEFTKPAEQVHFDTDEPEEEWEF